MKTAPLGEAKDKLSALVDEAERTHEIVTITRHGGPAAVLMSTDDLETLHETLYWLSMPSTRESVAGAERQYSTGSTTTGAALRAEFGLPAE
jgi:prevent-host-death family protein